MEDTEMRYLKNNKQVWIILIYFIFYLLIFYFLEHRLNTRIHILHSSFDDMIPFNEYFIVPYCLWFIYIAAAIVYFTIFNQNKTEFQQLTITLGIGMTLFLIISFIIPNGHTLRPVYFSRDNIFIDMVKYLYRTDTSTNIFPSIHVFNSVAVHIAVAKCDSLKTHRWVVRSSLILSVLIVLSTVFLKQHSILDVVGALILNFICYIKIYKPNQAMQRAIYFR